MIRDMVHSAIYYEPIYGRSARPRGMPDQESGRRSKIRNTTRATLAGVAVAVAVGVGVGECIQEGGLRATDAQRGAMETKQYTG
jgi:hypothetical protein